VRGLKEWTKAIKGVLSRAGWTLPSGGAATWMIGLSRGPADG